MIFGARMWATNTNLKATSIDEEKSELNELAIAVAALNAGMHIAKMPVYRANFACDYGQRCAVQVHGCRARKLHWEFIVPMFRCEQTRKPGVAHAITMK